ncbi:single-stranded nucleic acid binding R3H domain-containing protein [Thermodesulfobium narugense DSM 14796]|uniref:Single-stranded nucleic acid binding R3H domain-containing protein n=2 Tax=Thermodesulfobium narugense TaxID=184064 RepID=M1E7W6_9BACT|nr:single-stranded nucleic acid binding R3H domain-containing protein [Thermodesulfobium narugense DSM 14796]
MVKEILVSAKSQEEAIKKGLELLGIDEDFKYDYEVLEQPKKGLLGIGSKEAKIILRYTPTIDELISKVIKSLVKEIPSSNFSIDFNLNENTFYVDVRGENLGCLIGRHGLILKSIEFLLNRIAKINFNNYQINLDINNYWKDRTSFLYELSDKLVKKCIKYKRKVEFLPLPAHERKVIHVYLSKRSDLAVYSVGSGRSRHIVIEPVNNDKR